MAEPKWTPLIDYPGYSVTRGGRVYSVASNWRGYGIRELNQTPNSDGYPSVRLMVQKGRRKRVAVHKLVAATFLPPRPDGHELRHLSGIKADSNDTNLAWGTRADNAADRDRHGRTYRGAWDTPEKREKMLAAIRLHHEKRKQAHV